jgi:hypothetical protein
MTKNNHSEIDKSSRKTPVVVERSSRSYFDIMHGKDATNLVINVGNEEG